MLIPRFTLRSMLLAAVGFAVFAWIAAQAVRGADWAVAMCIAAGGVLAMFALYVGVFLLAYVIAHAVDSTRRPTPTNNPFADVGPPPQLVPPRDPE